MPQDTLLGMWCQVIVIFATSCRCWGCMLLPRLLHTYVGVNAAPPSAPESLQHAAQSAFACVPGSCRPCAVHCRRPAWHAVKRSWCAWGPHQQPVRGAFPAEHRSQKFYTASERVARGQPCYDVEGVWCTLLAAASHIQTVGSCDWQLACLVVA